MKRAAIFMAVILLFPAFTFAATTRSAENKAAIQELNVLKSANCRTGVLTVYRYNYCKELGKQINYLRQHGTATSTPFTPQV